MCRGFKARLYRTWISVLTQFHFAYLWQAECKELPLESSAELDMKKGVDAEVIAGDRKIALSIKKVTYRREAGEGRFSSRQMESWANIVEIPYTVDPPEECAEKERRAKKENTREKFRLYYELATRLQRRLPNGFVVFQPIYPRSIEKLLLTLSDQEKFIPWEKTLRFCFQP